MTPVRLVVSGWLAMTSALLAIPLFLLSLRLAGVEDLVARAMEAGLMVVGTALFVYLTITLRRLLHSRYAFHDTDNAIALLIKANVVLTTVGVVGLAVPSLASSVGLFTIICLLPLGIFQAYFGLRLMRLPDEQHALFRSYCYLNLATGLCLALVITAPLALLLGAITDVMLGTIFFQHGQRAKGHIPDTV
ncbi:hypothetical protein JN12_01307 [Geobacter argillaceus]|uniref:Uncharacterized protein n=2 Tax=Geobacter argillaceus TaxID=345631 RepID=A0A562VPK6_9BACT|nr:hypothetical protein JN12_01307 [Geobacter argillaceus]